jgi:hypothetical protein
MPLSNPTTPAGRAPSTMSQQELDSVLADSPTTLGSCEMYFNSNGKKLTDLMTMCMGLFSQDGYDRELGDALVEPYASMKFRKKVNPTQKHMAEEIRRRASFMGLDKPTCKYWTKERLQKWLNDNPIVEPNDIVFLVTEEKKLFDTVNLASNAKSAAVASNNARAGSWTTNVGCMRPMGPRVPVEGC